MRARRHGVRVAFQNESYYYFLGVTREAGQRVVRLEKHAGLPTSRFTKSSLMSGGPSPGIRMERFSVPRLQKGSSARCSACSHRPRTGELVQTELPSIEA